MGILLGFAPYIAFVLLANIAPDLALWTAFAAAYAIAIRDFARTKAIRGLDLGSTILFGLLAIYAGFIAPSISPSTVRLVVDSGFLIFAIVSVLARNPFTLDHTRDEAPREIWATGEFMRANYVLTGVWTCAFLITTLADGLSKFDNDLPAALDVAAGLAALAFAIAVTARYPLGGIPSRSNPRRP